MRKILFFTLLVLLSIGLVLPATAAEPIKIGIMQIVDHPALNATRDGVRDVLQEVYGYVPDQDIIYDMQSAQGDVATANTIARKFVSDQVDVIVSIATPTSQAAANATKEIPIVFSAVTDPVSAGLVKDLNKPGGNVTGVSDMTPVDRQVEMLKYVFPDAKNLGTVYNAGEVNSVVTNDLAKVACEKYGMSLIEATVSTSADVAIATQSLVGKVDAIYVSTDNTVVSALETVIKVCQDKKIPLILADPTTLEKGATMALGFDYYLHGRQTGDMVARILKGEKPSDIPVEFANKLVLMVNSKNLEILGVQADDFKALLEKYVEDMRSQNVEVTLEFK
ncbi:MAG TPA: ABC transporter substrate-binding protein [Atribacter sp.]|jgi:putative ABC transport system substrate-binding protein|uniref:ABC transporter substrate-binding protein n=1 Tax=Atribacter sp. TaxID=2847780 RepID=UPI002B76CFF1|nr:ABC transporter substrate-binding protein [Atribacter sp.]MDD3713666.1 ABC transporter substrate-binding protein [Atribacterota bacterium]MDI9593707.1 ABC transporter substrate-binding protein [Atribacterota bacterium]HQK82911.1 ABC transporter substrate-binding protein [Atribacter sp.]